MNLLARQTAGVAWSGENRTKERPSSPNENREDPAIAKSSLSFVRWSTSLRSKSELVVSNQDAACVPSSVFAFFFRAFGGFTMPASRSTRNAPFLLIIRIA